MPRRPSSDRSRCSAMMLRAVLAAQMNRSERKRGPLTAALDSFLLTSKLSDPPDQHLPHTLLARRALRQFRFERDAKFHWIPDGRLGDFPYRVPSFHQPDRSETDSENLPVAL